MTKSLKVSAIIPVFNEEKTVADIIKLLINHPLINEVICVNDASIDSSQEVLETFNKNITIVKLIKNKGKGYALSKGVESASGDIVLFLDADLGKLKNEHISALVNPLIQRKTKAVLGHTKEINKLWQQLLFQGVLTGQRAYFRKDLLPHLKDMSKTKYGIEIYLNNIMSPKDVKHIPLKDVNHSWKHKKYKRHTAVKKYIEHVIDVATEVGKQEGLLPRDYDTIVGLRRIKNTKETLQRINSLSNKRVKATLQRAFAEIFYD